MHHKQSGTGTALMKGLRSYSLLYATCVGLNGREAAQSLSGSTALTRGMGISEVEDISDSAVTWLGWDHLKINIQ